MFSYLLDAVINPKNTTPHEKAVIDKENVIAVSEYKKKVNLRLLLELLVKLVVTNDDTVFN